MYYTKANVTSSTTFNDLKHNTNHHKTISPGTRRHSRSNLAILARLLVFRPLSHTEFLKRWTGLAPCMSLLFIVLLKPIATAAPCFVPGRRLGNST